MRRKVAAGNWKMNGTKASEAELASLIANVQNSNCDVVICPPTTLLDRFVGKSMDSSIAIGGQDCHQSESGAFTGEISAGMLSDLGVGYVILGHSERRSLFAETNALIKQKAEAAHNSNLKAIICVGETEAERDSGVTLDVIKSQLSGSMPNGCTGENTIIAYEPVWAIGTGRTPSEAEIVEVHDCIRAHLQTLSDSAEDIRILYGGSVNPKNASTIFGLNNVDGGLVGGASLRATDFLSIIEAAS